VASEHVHVLHRPKPRVLGVEHPHVAQQDRACEVVGQARGERMQPLVLGLGLELLQLLFLSREILAQDLEQADLHHREQLLAGIGGQPDEHRLRVDPGDRIERDRLLAAGLREVGIGNLRHRDLTARQCRDAPLLAQCRAHHRRQGLEARVVGDVHGGGADHDAAVIGERLPLCCLAVKRKALADRPTEGRLAGDIDRRQRAVGRVLQVLVDIGTAAVVAVAHLDVHRAVAARRGGLRAGRSAAEDDGVVGDRVRLRRSASKQCCRNKEPHLPPFIFAPTR
jgi:hypothetical protein